jgi:hypothetical protein
MGYIENDSFNIVSFIDECNDLPQRVGVAVVNIGPFTLDIRKAEGFIDVGVLGGDVIGVEVV